MKKFFSLFCSLILLFTLFPFNVQAIEDQPIVSATINIYVNNEFVITDSITSEDIIELEYGTLPLGYLYGDTYGTLQSGKVYFNSVQGYFLAFDLDNPVILSAYGTTPATEDTIVVDLYYKNDNTIEEEPEYGNVLLEVTDGVNPVADYEITFFGKKGADKIELTEITDENGQLSIDLDISYQWTFIFNETTYTIDEFDFYTQLALPNDITPTQPIVDETQEYTVSITYYYTDEPGGTMENDVPDNYTHFEQLDDFTVPGGTHLNIQDYIKEVENYHLGATYVRTPGVYDNTDILVGDNVLISIVYVKNEEKEPDPIYYSVTYQDYDTNILAYFPNVPENGDTPLINNPTREGYTFTGWSPTLVYTVTEDTIYIAQYTENSTPPSPGHHPKDDPVIIDDDDIPLAPVPEVLNGDDHFAYIQGYPNGTVQPEGNITRAETATMLYRLLKPVWRDIYFTDQNDFSDVAQNLWYNKAVSSMANGEYIEGYPDNTFKGNNAITRAEFVTIMIRFLDEDMDYENPFSDIDNHWAKDYIVKAVGAGWIDGYPDGTFQPNDLITRAEAMKIINSVLHRGINEDSELGDFKNFPDNKDTTAWCYYEILEAINDHEYTGQRPNENWTRNAVDYIYDIEKYEYPIS